MISRSNLVASTSNHGHLCLNIDNNSNQGIIPFKLLGKLQFNRFSNDFIFISDTGVDNTSNDDENNTNSIGDSNQTIVPATNSDQTVSTMADCSDSNVCHDHVDLNIANNSNRGIILLKIHLNQTNSI